MKKFFRGTGFYLLLVLTVVLLASMINPAASFKGKEITYTAFLNDIKAGKVDYIYVVNKTVYGLKTGTTLKQADVPKKYDFKVGITDASFNDDYRALCDKANKAELIEHGRKYAPIPETPWWLSLIPYVVMIGLALLLYFFLVNQSQNGGSKVMNFGRASAKLYVNDKNKTTFKQVAGADEEKEELVEIVDFLKDSRKFIELGARIPKGVLLVGPPGTGKTLLAKATAGEAGVPFFSISGSDFVEMFVGVGASRVRDLFNQAKKNSPCIVFIDEIDAVGRHRGAGMGGGHDEREQTLNQLLVEMDGFSVNEGIIVLAATNRADILDPALLRPGRFDRQITVHMPDIKGREEIFKVHSHNKPLAPDVQPDVIAKMTSGFTGADIENLLNEAAILTVRRSKKAITMSEIEEAITRVIAGPEKRSRVVTEKDKRITAYHEAGHAVVAFNLPNCDPVHEISIVPRGMAAGYTLTLPDEDTSHMTRNKMLDIISEMMGGRVAEDVFIGDISTGAYNDLQRATALARRMITEFGMSPEMGPVFWGGDHEVFLGRDFAAQKAYSEEIAAQIDKIMKDMLVKAYDRAKEIIEDKRSIIETIAQTLLEKEKLTREEFAALAGGQSAAQEAEQSND